MAAATSHPQGLWRQARQAAIPILSWWTLLGCTWLTFAAVVLVTEGFDQDALLGLAFITVPTFAGSALGQVLAFLRVRSWIVLVFGGACWAVAFAVVPLGGGDVAALVGLFFFLLPISLTGGLWSLETNRAVWSLWLPMLLSTGAVILWSEHTGKDSEWFAGNKWAIWDLVTLLVLGITIVLGLLYLASRETQRLLLWRHGPRAPLVATVPERRAGPRLSFFGVLALFALAVGLTVGTALVAPYLWRTGPAEREGEARSTDPAPVEAPRPSGGCDGASSPPPTTPPPDPQSGEQLAERAVRAVQQASQALCFMVTLVMLGLTGILVGGPPMRRLLTVRYLRDPPGRVPATERIEQGWRLVEIALSDAGVGPRPGEDAQGLARRARPVLEKLSPVPVHGLEEAAEVADRVRFGLGVGPDDVAVMERFSGWVYDTVWERLSDGEQVRCMYRPL